MAHPISPSISAASSRTLILAILRQKERSYGYEIIQMIRRASDGRLDWKDGMLYPVLHRMEREGLIAASWGVSGSGRRRKYYRLLDKGRRVLEREAADWFAVHDIIMRIWKTRPALT